LEKENKFTFEEIFKQNENRIYYQIHKLGIRDPHQEFYMEGMYALWQAYKKYQPDKGPMTTYFNYIIRNRLIDMLRKEGREREKEEIVRQATALCHGTGNRNVRTDVPLVDGRVRSEVNDDSLLEEIASILTEKQMKYIIGFVVKGMTIREIAEQEGVTEDAVKGWGREAKKKLRNRGTGPVFQ
jgi:RNA polymerase sigma factor (sigma-70 family)